MTIALKKFITDESGATAIEYALIAAILGLGIIVGARSLENAVSKKFTDVGTAVGKQK